MKLKVIYKSEIFAGILWKNASGFHFEYQTEFISNEKTYPISVNLPKTQKIYNSERLFPNFQSILSEGYNRELQCKALGIDKNDDWSLLIHSCAEETIGAITLEKMEE